MFLCIKFLMRMEDGFLITTLKVKVSQSCLILCNPMDWNFPGQNTGVGSLSLLQGTFPIQGSNPGLPHCMDSLPAEPQEKPKNTGVGNLLFLQRIFPTQELNKGLLHSKRILYQLSYQRTIKEPNRIMWWWFNH